MGIAVPAPGAPGVAGVVLPGGAVLAMMIVVVVVAVLIRWLLSWVGIISSLVGNPLVLQL